MTEPIDLLACVQLMVESHAGQTRRLLGDQYVVHPIRMARSLHAVGASQEAVAAALLHDVVEDREPYDPELMRARVAEVASPRVAEIVDHLSEIKQHEGADLSWKERVTEALDRLVFSEDKEAWLVKVADMLDNSRDLAESLRRFGAEEVQKHFNAPLQARFDKFVAFAEIVRERDPNNLLLPQLDTALKNLQENLTFK